MATGFFTSAQAAEKTCKTSTVQVSEWRNLLPDAKGWTRVAWKNKVSNQYGPEWSKWEDARKGSRPKLQCWDCSKPANSRFPGCNEGHRKGYACQAVAYPCYQPRCKKLPVETRARGVGSGKQAAKNKAVDIWEGIVQRSPNLGVNWAEWKKAKDKKFSCRPCSEGTHCNLRPNDPYRGYFGCTASAKPCPN